MTQGPSTKTIKYQKPWVSLDIENRTIARGHDDYAGALKSVRQPIRILQISDCHLGERVGEQLAGMDTEVSLDYVLGCISTSESSDSGKGARLLIATGDLANHGSESAYQRLEQKLAAMPMPSVWLPGNHDDMSLMLKTAGESRLPGVVMVGNWAILLLDSTVPGQVEGEIGEAELDRVATTLAQLPAECHIMICVHHQVLPVGSSWLDQQQIADSAEFIQLFSEEKRLRLVVSGHVHQDSCSQEPALPGVKFITTPSTCIQFAPRTNDFKIDDKLPGYRWFDLNEDGSFSTGIDRVESTDLTMDLASSGY